MYDIKDTYMYKPTIGEDRSVIVFVIDKFGMEHYTTGTLTGEKNGEETYQLILESPWIEDEMGYFHKEDMYEFNDENIEKYIKN